MTAWIRAGAALALLTAALPAQALEIGERGQETGIEGSPVGPGFGVALGDPSGIALSNRFSDRDYVQGVVGWSFTRARFHASADYVRSLFLLEAESTPNLRYDLYAGLGGRLLLAETEPDRSKGAGKAPETRNDSAVGARVPLGLALFSKTQALDVYFELAPGLVLLPETRFSFEGAAGVRIYPWGRGKVLDED